jgi:hypothetical protein
MTAVSLSRKMNFVVGGLVLGARRRRLRRRKIALLVGDALAADRYQIVGQKFRRGLDITFGARSTPLLVALDSGWLCRPHWRLAPNPMSSKPVRNETRCMLFPLR